MRINLCAPLLLALSITLSTAAEQVTLSDKWMPYNAARKWGFLPGDAAKVEFTLPPSFDMAYPFKQGRAAIKQNKLWGFIDEKGTVVIPCQYDQIQNGTFRNGIAIVKKENQFGVIDRDGKEILPVKFKNIQLDENEGRLIVTAPNPADPNDFFGLSGLYDLTGKNLLPHEYSSIYPAFKGGVTAVEKAKKRALVSANGELLTPLQYDQLLHSDIAQFIAVKEGHIHDVYDTHGKLLFSANYPYVGAVNDNRAAFKDAATKLNGYLDNTGQIVIKPQFVMAGNFSEGLAIVQRATGAPVEAIDPSGKSIGSVPNAFIRLDKFKNGMVWLADRTDKKIYLYNKDLQKVFPQGFYYAADFDANGLARAQAAPKQNGLINQKGEWILQPEWTAIEPSSIPGTYIISKDREKGIANATGQILFKPQAISIEKWDDQFLKFGPAGFISNGDYLCFWRKDGVFFYNEKKAE